ncbi:MAG TPA: hypothetical protein VMW12_14110, partial [Candidatus Dormibacteraeota bacterium]|nr:hypothetical protein [Candidatus Dormibacteraeota bacterium]
RLEALTSVQSGDFGSAHRQKLHQGNSDGQPGHLYLGENRTFLFGAYTATQGACVKLGACAMVTIVPFTA